MKAVEARPADLPVALACRAIGVSRATLYRARKPRPLVRAPQPPSPRRLSDEERRVVIETLTSAEFADQPPAEVFATLLGRGVYLASIRTMYRVLAAHFGVVSDRRAQRLVRHHAMPSLEATAPNQVWTWDITKLAGPERGVFYCLYVIVDLFSRYVVGWMLAERESAELAQHLFAETCARHDIVPGSLTVHADRGGPMRSEGLAQLLADLGVERSFSRPRVSDDNAFSESQFKTLKYQPDYPRRFASMMHARAWLQRFFDWYAEHHHHSGLALFTPGDVFHGRVETIAIVRQAALDTGFAAHPERFPNGPPVVALPPARVAINPIATPIVIADFIPDQQVLAS
jgi:transposase InsO family protein